MEKGIGVLDGEASSPDEKMRRRDREEWDERKIQLRAKKIESQRDKMKLRGEEQEAKRIEEEVEEHETLDRDG